VRRVWWLLLGLLVLAACSGGGSPGGGTCQPAHFDAGCAFDHGARFGP